MQARATGADDESIKALVIELTAARQTPKASSAE